jgi:hypothetical protein
MGMKESKSFWSRKRPRGQSLVEFALMLPILLILLSGLFEFGFIFTAYLSVLDAARNAARFSSDSAYDTLDDGLPGNSTKFFPRMTAYEAVIELAQEQPTITLCIPGAPVSQDCPDPTNNPRDDVIISVFSVLRDTSPAQIVRFPSGTGENGWSYDADLMLVGQGGSRTGMHQSQFTTSNIASMLQSGTPNTGYVLVEINYNYNQMLGVPWFTQFVGDPIPFHIYALWPCVSAEPTPT